jgi:hypothetical protein
MANRVIIGKRGSDYGLFVSKSGDDVTTTTNPLGFDSRAVESFIVHSYGEGILVPDVQHRTTGAQLTYTYSGTTYNQHTATITHGLGYIPAFAVRWCSISDLDGTGKATKVFTPHEYEDGQDEYEETDQDEEGDEITFPQTSGNSGLRVVSATTTAITLHNTNQRKYDNVVGKATTLQASAVYAYSYVIFTAENFLNGESL